ncbi:hypothetical protein B9Z55_011741 [Caenorhabditis nigoni]|uniref:Uncharacterized protein n=1 Tax=Caenorhabditis nigoni TaxID=1611254 RepID=A0A2G5UMA9_9PELO|nr:hypothetical protein B9Z55_011741 [Caenorhabditis nigoni]
MKEINGSRDVFQELASQLEEKPSLEECQLSRKSRYFHRQTRQKSISEESEKTKKKLFVEESSSDDEMPTVPPPKIRKKKKAETPRKIVEIDIVSDADRSPSPTPTIDLVDLTKDSGDEMQIPDILPEREEIPERILMLKITKKVGFSRHFCLKITKFHQILSENRPIFSPPHFLRGRLPKWYNSRKLENEKKQKILAEKREIREKLEKEREETQRKQEQLEKRRFLDRERHRRRREAMQKNRESEKNSGKIEPKNGKKNGKKAEENAPKKSKKEKKCPILTDPSVNPSTISLEKVDIVPWASSSKKPRQAESIVTSSAQNLLEAVQNTPTSSDSSDDVFRSGNQEVEITLLENVEVMEDGDVQILEPQFPEDLQFEEPLFFEEIEEPLKIPDAEIQQIDANDVIEDSFLSIINDDKFSMNEFDQYLNV